MRVLISGASIAGPTLAYWLDRYGFEVTVVEFAPALRSGGYAVDFRGGVQLAVLDRMGLLDQVRGHQTGGHPARFVDETDATVLSLPREFTGGNLEIQRADLSRLLYDHSLVLPEYSRGVARSDAAGTTARPTVARH
jgi:2-polyprenyl-6-methoxyphenol hydroxylase-like FAD-dependent oxidoreductase